MRTKDIIGYVFLVFGLYLFGIEEYQAEGLFFQGMALGTFVSSAYEQLKNKKK